MVTWNPFVTKVSDAYSTILEGNLGAFILMTLFPIYISIIMIVKEGAGLGGQITLNVNLKIW